MRTTNEQGMNPQTHEVDERLELLEGQPQLKNLVASSLRAGSLKSLETGVIHELQNAVRPCDLVSATETPVHPSGDVNWAEKNGISLMLSAYQDIVRLLLEQDHYDGISADDLDLFKNQFRSMAFTCRLRSCPRATTGFVSEELRRQHEIDHTQLSICTVPECKYPPFVSIRALKNHMDKHHHPKVTHKPIRQVGTLGLQRNKDIGQESRNSPASKESLRESENARPRQKNIFEFPVIEGAGVNMDRKSLGPQGVRIDYLSSGRKPEILWGDLISASYKIDKYF